MGTSFFTQGRLQDAPELRRVEAAPLPHHLLPAGKQVQVTVPFKNIYILNEAEVFV